MCRLMLACTAKCLLALLALQDELYMEGVGALVSVLTLRRLYTKVRVLYNVHCRSVRRLFSAQTGGGGMDARVRRAALEWWAGGVSCCSAMRARTVRAARRPGCWPTLAHTHMTYRVFYVM